MIKRILRFIWKWVAFLLVCILALNSITFLVLTYRKADQAYIDECTREIRTRFKTTLTAVNTSSEVKDFKERLKDLSEAEAGRLVTKEIPAGTKVKVLAIYRKELNGKTKPRYYNIYQEHLIELPDGTRGYAELPEACIGMRLEDKDGNSHTITDIRKREAKHGESPYYILIDGGKQSYEFKDFIFLHDKNSRGYTWPVYTDNPGITGLRLSLGKGFYSYPFIFDLFIIPYWIRLILGIFGVLFLFCYIPFKYFMWLSNISAKPLYNDKLTATQARRKASIRHAIGWWAFFILTGSIINPIMWFILWLTSTWSEELDDLMECRCPKCNKMGVIKTTDGYEIHLTGTSVENFEEYKNFESGIASRDGSKCSKYLSYNTNRQTIEIKGRRKVYHYLSKWNEHYACPFCGYKADKKVSSRSQESGEVIDGDVKRTTYSH